MKIAVNTRFLLPDKLEGIGVYKHELLRRLTLNNPQHEFYFFFDRPYDQRFIYSANIKPIVLYPPARHPFLYYIWFEFSVARALRKIKPDVFLSLDTYTTLNTAVPRVTLFHDLSFEHNPGEMGYIDQKYYQYFFPRFARVSEKLMAVSEFTKQDVVQTYGIGPAKIEVVYSNAGPQFKPTPFNVQVQTRQQYTHGEAYFIFVGAIQPRKNLVNIFRGFDLFKTQTGTEVKLLIVGRKGWTSAAITKTYEQMAFKDEVIFTGRIPDEDVVKLYGGAVATIFPSIFEGFGLPIVEGQNCGCPVITATTSAMPEIAGDAAILVDPYNAEAIAAAMAQVYHDVDKRQDLIRKGFENAKRFSWDENAAKVMRVLEETVNSYR